MTRPKILLVDDTKLILELEKSYLKLSEVEVITAGNGREALETVRRTPPDVIFMDLNMPEMDGITCCAELKKDPFYCDIPVIMLTTAGNEEDRERAAQAGCNGYLTKPIDRREFLTMARKYTVAVDRRQLRVSCQVPLLLLEEGTPVGAETVDISDGGLYVASGHPLPQDAQIRLALYLPGPSGFLLEGSARVAWTNAEEHRVKPALPAGFGVEFVNLPESQLTALEAFMDAEEVSRSCDGTA
ncbi:MAG TPA: response regulator [Geomonas sp.]|nr:response regulator [Geomonas sp.]